MNWVLAKYTGRPLVLLPAALILLATPVLRADELSDGRALADQLLAQHPTKDYAATGTLNIRDANGQTTVYPATFKTVLTTTNWQSIYEVGDPHHSYTLTITHADGRPNIYFYSTHASPEPGTNGGSSAATSQFSQIAPQQAAVPFAGSDFWMVDLGIEFFHWPRQKLIKKEIKRSRGCSVLESTNPNPDFGGYSRVVSWIDSETGGIVQAKAYDAKDQLLKEFYPKDFKKDKVSDEWQVGMMEMDNDQTDSRSRLEFDPQQ